MIRLISYRDSRRLPQRMKDLLTRRPAVLVMVYSLYGGGAERVACLVASGLAKHYRVILLACRKKGQTYPLDPDVEVVYYPEFFGTSEMVIDQQAYFTRSVKKVCRVKVSLSFMYYMNDMNVRSRWKEKVVCSERNDPSRREPWNMEAIERLYASADHVVFQSAAVRDQFSPAVREHASILPNPVRVSCRRREPERPRIVTVGRLNKQKNHALLIRAFAAFRQSHPDHTLELFGEGDLEEELRSLSASLGVEQAVIFHGNTENVHEKIADAEMFVLSSDYEGMSNALLECMTMGLPCVSTACGASPELIRSGENGILTETGDEEALCRAMTRLADDPALRRRLGAQAEKDAERFREETVLAEWRALIEELRRKR